MKKQYFCRQRGFTLVEMAIVVLIMGMIVGTFFSYLSVQRQKHAEDVTKQHEEKIARALASYAQMNYKLPCPSLPKPAGVPYGQQITSCHTPQDRMGIVPFRDIGLSQQDVTDGWGNAISYAVAELAAYPASPGSNSVHAACRTPNWIHSGINQNPAKAVFCCQYDTSMKIYINMIPENLTADQSGVPSSDYNVATTPPPAGFVNEESISYIAYVLISHGKNGLGAHHFCEDPNGPSCNNTPNDPPTSINEANNAMTGAYANSTTYVAGPRSTSAAQYFDDIVLWRTQDRIMSEFNNNSCAMP